MIRISVIVTRRLLVGGAVLILCSAPTSLAQQSTIYPAEADAALTASVLALPFLAQKTSQSLPWKRCDADENGVCDQQDFNFVRGLVGRCKGSSGFDLRAHTLDIDSDGCITLTDYRVWLQFFREGQ